MNDDKRKPGRPRTGRGRNSARVQVRLSPAEAAKLDATVTLYNNTPGHSGHTRASIIRLALAAWLGFGCSVAPIDLPADAPVDQATDLAQLYTPFDRTAQTWRYCGPETLRVHWSAAVAWWAEQGQLMAAEVPCAQPADVTVLDFSDQRGPDGEWAHVYYLDWLGRPGANVKIFEGALSADWGRKDTLMRHELGHVFGLQHSSDSRCLMWGDGLLAGVELCPWERQLLGR